MQASLLIASIAIASGNHNESAILCLFLYKVNPSKEVHYLADLIKNILFLTKITKSRENHACLKKIYCSS